MLQGSGMRAGQSWFTEILEHAGASAGGFDALARYLDVEQERVAAWLHGSERPTLEAVMNMLDLITDRPYAHSPRSEH
jgi:hypothetical protein